MTPPPSGSPGGGFEIGRIYFEPVLPPRTFQVPVTVSATYTGELEVGSYSGALSFTSLGAATGAQQRTINMLAGKGTLLFGLAYPTTSPSTLTFSVNVGSPNGARVPYINDFSRGGQTNIAVWRPSQGNWYVYGSSDSPITTFGQAGDVPVAGDYDGDGISDYAVWRPSQGLWYIFLSSTGQILV
ncbi:MAG: hypothetical protein JO210_02190, partial [Acidobacteriaceae bacterium]|nr:hypothetical protein [Acidobacteriaceae bacterium]